MDSSLEPAAEDVNDPVEQLVEGHLDYARALAHKIAKKLPAHVDAEELVGYAMIGLTQAAQAFDTDLGVAFTTFSYYRIRGAVFDGIRSMHWLPPAARRSNAEMEAHDSLCDSGLGEVALEDGDEQVAREFREAIKSLGAVFLLSEAGVDEVIEPVDEASEVEPETRELAALVREALASLDEQQATVVRSFYFEHKSMSDIARELGLNKSTVSRAHSKAIEVLRDVLAA